MINLDLNLIDDNKPLVITFVDKKYTSILINWVAFLNEYKNYQVLFSQLMKSHLIFVNKIISCF